MNRRQQESNAVSRNQSPVPDADHEATRRVAIGPKVGRRAVAAALLGLAGALGLPSCASSRACDRGPGKHGPVSCDQPTTAAGNAIVAQAKALIGVPYRWGGNDPRTGLDCSGLVVHVYRQAAGLHLPRTTRQLSERGSKVARDRLAPSDLVFFNTSGTPFSHVAIYIGDDRFVHAPTRRGRVRIESLQTRYWRDRYQGARRPLVG